LIKEILSVQLDANGEMLVIATIKDREKKIYRRNRNFKSLPEKSGSVEIWKSENKEIGRGFRRRQTDFR